MKKDQQEHKLQPEEPEVRLMLREREEPEPQKTKEEQGEPKIQGDEQLVLKQETGISVVTPAYEETSLGDPELKTEQIPSPNQEQEGSRNEDSGLRKDEELRRNQRFLLTRDDADGPELKTGPNVTELPQRCVWKEVLSDQLLCNEDRNFSLDQKKREPPQIKEEGEEHCISSDGQQLVWKQETETCMVTPNVGKSHHCEQKPHWDQLLFKNSPEAENQDEKESWTEEPRPDREEVQKQNPQIKDPRDDADGPKLRRPNKALADEKPVSCQTCGKSFSQKGSLSYHMRTHTGEKPYACDMCGKCFFYSCHLTQHMRTHTGEKPFSCHICGKSYNYRNVLITHLRTHTGEKPYPCTFCGKCFHQSGSLTHHMRIHTGEKPFSCLTCGRSFTYKNVLVKHIKTHTGEKPFSCHTCGKSFIQKVHLRSHLRTHE
nr:zinc finger protein 37 homolog [Nothobranchius furzeri]XP_054590456.1 zinc finger protein 37 homolog [Nothobranchius furzeri]